MEWSRNMNIWMLYMDATISQSSFNTTSPASLQLHNFSRILQFGRLIPKHLEYRTMVLKCSHLFESMSKWNFIDTILLWCLTLLNHINSSLHLLSIATEFSCYFVKTISMLYLLWWWHSKVPRHIFWRQKGGNFVWKEKMNLGAQLYSQSKKTGVFCVIKNILGVLQVPFVFLVRNTLHISVLNQCIK